jgi:uncharacterized integral membrane protein (TIGR00698 family)
VNRAYFSFLPGLTLSFTVGIFAFVFAKFLPVGSVAVAIVLGIVVSSTFKFDEKYAKGLKFTSDKILAFSIALLGIDLNFKILAQLGFQTLFLIILSMIFTILSALWLGKVFNLNKKLALTLGIGNGVCGSAAIAASSKVIKPSQNDIAVSLAVVNLLGTIGIFFVPFLGYLFNFNDLQNGILIGNTLQAVGQVVASGFSVNEFAGANATVVKMGRVLLLAPLVLMLIYFFKSEHVNSDAAPKFPSFILWFIFFSFLATFEVLPASMETFISSLSSYTLLLAMSGVGLSIKVNSIKEDAKTALKFASVLFVLQILFSIFLLFTLF